MWIGYYTVKDPEALMVEIVGEPNYCYRLTRIRRDTSYRKRGDIDPNVVEEEGTV